MNIFVSLKGGGERVVIQPATACRDESLGIVSMVKIFSNLGKFTER